MANRMQTSPGSSSKQKSGSTAMQSGNGQVQVASDHLYGVVSVLYHALQGAQTYQQYIDDARQADAPEVEEFFNECQKEEQQRAERAKLLLSDLLDDEREDEEEAAGGDSEEDEDDGR